MCIRDRSVQIQASPRQFKCIVKNCEKKGNFSRIIWKFLIKRDVYKRQVDSVHNGRVFYVMIMDLNALQRHYGDCLELVEMCIRDRYTD